MTDLTIAALKKLGAVSVTPSCWMFHGDALRLLSELPTGCATLGVADPPYHLSNGGTTNSGGKRVSVDKGRWDASAGLREDFAFEQRWLTSLRRVLSADGAAWVFGTQHNIFSVGFAAQIGGWRLINTIAWEKANPTPNQGCRCFTHSWEAIMWASPNHDEPQRHVFNYDDAKAETGKQMRDVWRFGAPTAPEKALGKHPTQKPLHVLRRIVDLSSSPGALVVDPFAGSATTGVAALELGRAFVGAEMDAEHFELAVRRLRAAANP